MATPGEALDDVWRRYTSGHRGNDHPIILNQGGANSIFYHFFHETARFCEEGGGVDCCLMLETLFVHVCCCLLLFVDACCCLLLFLAAVVAVVVVLSKKNRKSWKTQTTEEKMHSFCWQSRDNLGIITITHKYPLYRAYIGISHRGTLVGYIPLSPEAIITRARASFPARRYWASTAKGFG